MGIMRVCQHKACAIVSLDFRSRTAHQVERQRYGLSTTWLCGFFRCLYTKSVYHKIELPRSTHCKLNTRFLGIAQNIPPQPFTPRCTFLINPSLNFYINFLFKSEIYIINCYKKFSALHQRSCIIKLPALARNSYQMTITNTDTGWINYYCHTRGRDGIYNVAHIYILLHGCHTVR